MIVIDILIYAFAVFGLICFVWILYFLAISWEMDYMRKGKLNPAEAKKYIDAVMLRNIKKIKENGND